MRAGVQRSAAEVRDEAVSALWCKMRSAQIQWRTALGAQCRSAKVHKCTVCGAELHSGRVRCGVRMCGARGTQHRTAELQVTELRAALCRGVCCECTTIHEDRDAQYRAQRSTAERV